MKFGTKHVDKEIIMDITEIIKANLKVGQTLKNWTPLNGYKGNNIIITKIDDSSISFDAPTDIKGKVTKASVSYSEINQVYKFWDKIKNGAITRIQYTNEGIKSRKTRYILDILKELDNQHLI